MCVCVLLRVLSRMIQPMYSLTLTTLSLFSPSSLRHQSKLFEFEFENDDPNAIKAWLSPDYFLEMKKGDIKSHALLMVSLLLGIKVDAYV